MTTMPRASCCLSASLAGGITLQTCVGGMLFLNNDLINVVPSAKISVDKLIIYPGKSLINKIS